MGQVCRLHREVEYVSGRRAGECTSEWAYALTSLTPERADPARLLQVWRGQWQIENGLHYVRDVTLGGRCQPDPLWAGSRRVCGRAQHGPGADAAGFKQPNVAAAQRRYAMYPWEALALLGITPGAEYEMTSAPVTNACQAQPTGARMPGMSPNRMQSCQARSLLVPLVYRATGAGTALPALAA